MIDNGDGTVTDEAIGLMWQQETFDKAMVWKQTGLYCKKLKLGGYNNMCVLFVVGMYHELIDK